MKTHDEQRRAQDLPAILECYAMAKKARRRRWRRLKELAPWIWIWVLCFVLGILLALAAGCYDPCDTRREHPRPARSAARQQDGGRECGVRTDPAGRHLPAFGQKDCGPTASRRPARATEDAAILPANPPVQSAVTRPHSALHVPRSIARLLDAIRQVESSNRPDPLDGDGGRSIGPYQIQRDYWTDARVAWPYQAVRGEREARLTVLAYWRRHAPAALAAGDLETLARLHNGGPAWAAKPATSAYWRRVRAALAAVRFNAENAEK